MAKGEKNMENLELFGKTGFNDEQKIAWIVGFVYLKDENKIPWTISNPPPDSVFKGREKKLDTLVNHYLSKDRSQTYILYGLTRTGKSSMLDYLRDRINGQSLKEDNSVHIMTFKWYLNEFSYINRKNKR